LGAPPAGDALTMMMANPLHGLEERLGAERPGRSWVVWLGPLVTAIGTFVMLAWAIHIGGLGIEAWLPIGLFGALILGGLSVSYLFAFAADARDAEAADDRRS
jgi:hypothetical protein